MFYNFSFDDAPVMKFIPGRLPGFFDREIKIKILMKFLFILLLFPFYLFAQKNAPLAKDLSGVWAGTMYNDTTRVKSDFEIAISENNGKINGYTYTVFLIDGRKNIGIKSVKIKKRENLLLVEDEKLINDNYDAPPAKGVRTFIEMHYSENDTSEMLSGTWKTNVTRQYNSVTGSLLLVRKKKPEETAIVPKLRELNLLDQLSFLPKPLGSQQKNSTASAKLPEDIKQTGNSQNNIPEIENNTAGLVKKDEQKLVPEKIIPDTTITNPEITIFMFPKNDSPAKDTSKIGIKKDLRANEKESASLNLDSLLVMAAKKEQAHKEIKIIPTEKQKNLAEEKTNPVAQTAINKVPSVAKKATETNSIIIEKRNAVGKEPLPAEIKKTSEKNTENKADLEVVKKEMAGKELKTIPSEKLKKAPGQKSNPVVAETAKNKESSVVEKATETDSKFSVNKNERAIESLSSDSKKTREKNQESPEVVKKERAATNSNKTDIIPYAQPAKTISAEMLLAREINTIQTVEISRDTLVFSLFDNGVIDGDTVSVLLNGKVIMSRIGLLAKAYNDTIYLTPEMGDSINIILYAENLGSIPPNTGLLVVRDGGIDHEIRFSGDLKKNSAIILKRKKNLNER